MYVKEDLSSLKAYGISFADVASKYRVGQVTVERWYHGKSNPNGFIASDLHNWTNEIRKGAKVK